MTPRTFEYYDWFLDLEPEILKNLNKLLVNAGTDPVKTLHGGWWHEGKWVSSGKGEYRNFWHVYLDLWGEIISNDSYVITYFPSADEDEWNYCRDKAIKNYGFWATLLVDAVKNTVIENNLYDEHGDSKKIVIWFSW